MSTYINPDAIIDGSIEKEKLSDELNTILDTVENLVSKIQIVSLPSASGSITKDVYTAMGVANVVKFIYNNGQYELVMTVKEQISGSIAYSTMFFSAKESMFKSFSVEFAPPSSNSNAVGYQVTLANLAIGAATVSE